VNGVLVQLSSVHTQTLVKRDSKNN